MGSPIARLGRVKEMDRLTLDKITRELRSRLRCVTKAIRCIEQLREAHSRWKALEEFRLEEKEADREIAAFRREHDVSRLHLVRKRR